MRRVGRAFAAIAGIAFGCAAYRLPDAAGRAQLRTTQSHDAPRSWSCARARRARTRRGTPPRAALGAATRGSRRNLVRAVLLDRRREFWKHDGLDYEQIKESVEVNLERGEFARGASTITQQLAKNLYLSPSKNPVRKLRELLIARRLEAELTKQRILELYLNVIEWGDGDLRRGSGGADVFRQVCRRVCRRTEAALLAASIANPRVMNPAHPTARLRRRQSMVLRRMGAVDAAAGDRTTPPADAGCRRCSHRCRRSRRLAEVCRRHCRSARAAAAEEARECRPAG